MVQALSDEFGDIEKKIPKELKPGAGGHKFDDFEWLNELLNQARPLLLQRLLRRKDVQ